LDGPSGYSLTSVEELQASIEINAPAERVWDVLSDLSRYEEWNPFMTQAEGELIEGTKLAIRIEPPGGREMQFKPTVLEVEPRRRVRWLGRFILPGIFDGEHTLAIEPVGEATARFSQRERFSGILTAFSGKLFDRTQTGFEAMNEALKRRCERV
jgi:hypothetical protein